MRIWTPKEKVNLMLKPLRMTTGLLIVAAFFFAKEVMSCTLDTDCKPAEMCAAGQCVERAATVQGAEAPASAESTSPDGSATAPIGGAAASPPEASTGAASALTETPPNAAPNAVQSTPPFSPPVDSLQPASSAPAPASAIQAAAPSPSSPGGAETAKGVRLDFFTPLFNVDYNHSINGKSTEADPQNDELYIGFGPMSGLRFGIGLGGVANEHITAGARVIMGLAISKPDTDSSVSLDFSYGILPYFNFAFGHRRIKPFIEVALGVVGNAGDLLGDTVSFAAAAGPGLRIQCGSRAAVDLWLNETLTVGSAIYFDNPYSSSEHREGSYLSSNTGLMLGLDILI
jgi:hypothetical protein